MCNALNELIPSDVCRSLEKFLKDKSGTVQNLTKLGFENERGRLLFSLFGINAGLLEDNAIRSPAVIEQLFPDKRFTSYKKYKEEITNLFNEIWRINGQNLINGSTLHAQPILTERSALLSAETPRELLIRKLLEYWYGHDRPIQLAWSTGLCRIAEINQKMKVVRKAQQFAIAQLYQCTEIPVRPEMIRAYAQLDVTTRIRIESIWFKYTALKRGESQFSWTDLLVEWLERHPSGQKAFCSNESRLLLQHFLSHKFKHIMGGDPLPAWNGEQGISFSTYVRDETIAVIAQELDCQPKRLGFWWWPRFLLSEDQGRLDLLTFIELAKKQMKEGLDLKKRGPALIRLLLELPVYQQESNQQIMRDLLSSVLYYLSLVYPQKFANGTKAALFKYFLILKSFGDTQDDFLKENLEGFVAYVDRLTRNNRGVLYNVLSLLDLASFVSNTLLRTAQGEMDKLSDCNSDYPFLAICFLSFFYEKATILSAQAESTAILRFHLQSFQSPFVKQSSFLYNFLHCLLHYLHLTLFMEIDQEISQQVFSILYVMGVEDRRKFDDIACRPFPEEKVKIGREFLEFAVKHGLALQDIGSTLLLATKLQPQSTSPYLTVTQLVTCLKRIESETAAQLPREYVRSFLHFQCFLATFEELLNRIQDLRQKIAQEHAHRLFLPQEIKREMEELIANLQTRIYPSHSAFDSPLLQFYGTELDLMPFRIALISQLLGFVLYPFTTLKMSAALPDRSSGEKLIWEEKKILPLGMITNLHAGIREWRMAQYWMFTGEQYPVLETFFIHSLSSMRTYYFQVPLKIPMAILGQNSEFLGILKQAVKILCEESVSDEECAEIGVDNFRFKLPSELIIASYNNEAEEFQALLSHFPYLQNRWERFEPKEIEKTEAAQALLCFVKTLKLKAREAIWGLIANDSNEPEIFTPQPLTIPNEQIIEMEVLYPKVQELFAGKMLELYVEEFGKFIKTGSDKFPSVRQLQLIINREILLLDKKAEVGLRFHLSALEIHLQAEIAISCPQSLCEEMLANSACFERFVLWMVALYKKRLETEQESYTLFNLKVSDLE